MKPRLKRLLGLGLILLTLVVVLIIGISDNSLGKAWEAVKSLDVKWILLCILAYLTFVLMDSLAIMYYLRRQGYRIGFGSMYFNSVIGQYYSNITPGATGGQPMQVYYMAKAGVPGAVGTSAIVIRFFCFQFMLSVIGTVLWLIFKPFVDANTGGNRWILIMGYVYNIFMLAVGTVLSLYKPLIKKVIDWGIRIGTKFRWIKKPEETEARLFKSVDTYQACLMYYRRKPLDLVVQMVFGGLQLLAVMSIIYCIYRGMGLREYGYWHLVTMNVCEYISAAHAPLPGASGAQEGVFAMYFSQIFSEDTRFAALLLWRFFTYYISLILGFVVIVAHGIRSGIGFRESVRSGHETADAVMESNGEYPETGGEKT